MQNRTIKWGDVLKIYMSVFDDNLKVTYINDSNVLGKVKNRKEQIKYDRLYDRKFDNGKICEIVPLMNETSVYKGYKQDKIEMRGDRAEMSDFPLYLNTVAGGLDRRDQTIGGFSFVVKIYAVPVVEIIG